LIVVVANKAISRQRFIAAVEKDEGTPAAPPFVMTGLNQANGGF
jgi:hypothetical protein